MVELYGIAELSGVYAVRRHFVGTRQEPLDIDGDPIEHIFSRHRALGVHNVIWNLGRSYVDFHTEHPLLTMWGELTQEEGLEANMPERKRNLLDYYQYLCPLSKAIDVADDLGMPIWGWLCMNRFYAHDPGMSNQTRFWHQHHVDMAERYKDGTRDDSRLCYAFPEYRKERLTAVSEAAKVQGMRSQRHIEKVILDFVRQPPMLQYHPYLCRAYERETGRNARQILAHDVASFLPWVRWRASILTEFVRHVREELDRVGQERSTRIGLGVRITDLGPNINLIEGVDIVALCEEGLVDVVVTSPLNWIRNVSDHDLRPYVGLGRRHGIPVIAGVSLNQMTRFHSVGGSVSGAVLVRRVHDYQQQGADGIAFYQSESGLEFDGFDQFIPALADPEETTRLLADERFLTRWPVTHLNSAYGLDCHSWFNNFTIDGHTDLGNPDCAERGPVLGERERLI